MKIKVIEKKNIRDLLRQTAAKAAVFVPQKYPGGDVWMAALPRESEKQEKALENVVLGDEEIIIPPKDIFFPQLESMFEFAAGEINETVETSAKILFGVKACDLKAILFADDFFRRNFEDKYYLSRIRRRFIVVIGCLRPPRPEGCFCTSAGTGPFAEAGFDLQLVDAGDFYFVEVGSKQGEQFLSRYKEFFRDSAEGTLDSLSRIKTEASGAVELKVDFLRALELMADDNFLPRENYQRIGERCIYCGGCLYVCPTCTCFNVFDDVKDDRGRRYRNWDACVFEGYTREASGHNPRDEKWLRTARRYEHKLKYDYQLTGTSGCVGCGRCLVSCPVNIGISGFIQEITEDKKVL